MVGLRFPFIVVRMSESLASWYPLRVSVISLSVELLNVMLGLDSLFTELIVLFTIGLTSGVCKLPRWLLDPEMLYNIQCKIIKVTHEKTI